ncbi:hypothetical protein [Burkholderia cepacia]|nr:hypothetical protein [Burkholderia cepacia]
MSDLKRARYTLELKLETVQLVRAGQPHADVPLSCSYVPSNF